MTARDLVTLVGLEHKREQLGCSDTNCLVELAGSLGADGVVIVSVGVVNGQTIAAGRVLNPTTAVVLARATVVAGEGNLVATVRRIGQAVRRAYREARGLKPTGGAIAAQASGCAAARECDAECQAGSSSACSRLGALLRASGRPAATIAATLQRACELGEVASCLGAAEAWVSAGQHATAADPLRRACVAPLEPVASACGRSGVLLLHGKVVPRDLEQGLSHLRRGCIEGYAQACLDLGQALQPGGAAPGDEELHVSALGLGCRGGLGDACAALARAHLGGRGAPRDPGRAAWAARRECELAGPSSCLALATSRLQGGEQALALEMRRGLCSSDLPTSGPACAGAALQLLKGPVTLRDLGEARTLAKRGCARGDDHACLVAARVEVEASPVGADLTRTVELLRRAPPCDESCGEVATAILLRSRGTSPTSLAVASFASEQCQAGSGAACAVAASASLSGRGVVKDEARAVALLEKGCTQGSGLACLSVADLLQHGQGTEPNAGQARRRLQRACFLDVKQACP